MRRILPVPTVDARRAGPASAECRGSVVGICCLTVEVEVVGNARTIRTLQGAERTTRSATLPIKTCTKPVRPCVRITISTHGRVFTTSQRGVVGSPHSTRVSIGAVDWAALVWSCCSASRWSWSSNCGYTNDHSSTQGNVRTGSTCRRNT